MNDATGGKLGGIQSKLLAMDKAAQRMHSKLASLGYKAYTATIRLIDRVTPQGSKINNLLRSLASKAYNISLKINDSALAKIRSVEASLMRLAGRAYTVAINVKDNVSSKLRGLTDGALMGMGATMLGAGGIGYGMVNAVQSSMGFEKQMSRVQALRQLDKNSEDMKALTELAKKLGMETAWTREQVGQAMEYQALAGWETPQILKATPHMLNLASAGGMDLGAASDMLTDAMTAFGLKATDTFKNAAGKVIDMPEYFADMLAKVQASSNTDLYQLKEAMKYGAPTIGTMFANVEGQEGIQMRTEAARQMMIMAGLMANAGIKGSMAGTGINTIFNRLAGENRNTHFAERLLGLEHAENGNMLMPLDFIKGFQKKIREGMNVEDFMQVAEELAGEKIHADTRRKLDSTIESALKNGGKLGSADIMKMSSMLAGLENMPKLLAMVFQDIDALEAKMNDVEGTAGGMAETMLDNLAGSFTKLGSAWDAFQQDLFTGTAGDSLRGFVDTLTEILTHANNLFKDGIQIGDFGQIIADVVDRLKKKFLELDGVGSILAGGALMAGLMKIVSTAQKAIGYFKTLKGLEIGQRIGGVTGTKGTGAISGATSVGTMTVTAGVVNVNGKVGGGAGGVGGRRIGDQTIIDRYNQEKARIRGTGTPPPPSIGSTMKSAAMGGAAFAAVFGALDVMNAKSMSRENATAIAAELETARTEYNNLRANNVDNDTLYQSAQKIQSLESQQAQIIRENQQGEREALGGATGSVIGAALGSALGSFFPGFGTMIGGMIGGIVGGQLGTMAAQIETPATVAATSETSTVSQDLIENKTAERLGITKPEENYAFKEIEDLGLTGKTPLSYITDKRKGQNFFGKNGEDIIGAYERYNGKESPSSFGNLSDLGYGHGRKAAKVVEDNLSAFETETALIKQENLARQKQRWVQGSGRWQGQTPQQQFNARRAGEEAKASTTSHYQEQHREQETPFEKLGNFFDDLLFHKAAAAELNESQLAQQAAMERGESPTAEMTTPELETPDFGESMLEKLSSAQEGVGEFISGLSETISEGFNSAFEGASETLSTFAESIMETLSGSLEGVGEIFTGLGESISESLSSAFETASEVVSTFGDMLGEGLTSALEVAGEMFSGFGEMVSSALTTAQGAAESALAAIGSAFESAKSSIMSSWSELPGFFGGLFDGLGGIASAAGSAIYSGLTSVIGSIIGAWQSAASTISGIISSIASMASSAASSISLPSFGGGGGTGFAEGGFVNSETHFFAGEHGPEVIIPLSSSKRARALDLFEKTGAILGGETAIPASDYTEDLPSFSSGSVLPTVENDTPTTTTTNQKSSSTTVSMGGLNVTFNITGDKPQEIMQTIKENLDELADRVMGVMSGKVADCFNNQALEG